MTSYFKILELGDLFLRTAQALDYLRDDFNINELRRKLKRRICMEIENILDHGFIREDYYEKLVNFDFIFYSLFSMIENTITGGDLRPKIEEFKLDNYFSEYQDIYHTLITIYG